MSKRKRHLQTIFFKKFIFQSSASIYKQVLCAFFKAVMITVSMMVMVIKLSISISIVSKGDITIVNKGAIIINMLRSRVPACVLDSGRKKASINFTRLSCKILSLYFLFLLKIWRRRKKVICKFYLSVFSKFEENWAVKFYLFSFFNTFLWTWTGYNWILHLGFDFKRFYQPLKTKVICLCGICL